MRPMDIYFPFSEYWLFYLCFTFGVLGLLALDLGVFHRESHAVHFREASIWTIVWIGCAVLFGVGLHQFTLWKFSSDPQFGVGTGVTAQAEAWRLTMEYFVGYLVEKSLAVDNVFVFAVIFSSLGILPKHQHKILFYGVLGALVFRMIFIAMGSYLMGFHVVVVLFGIFLMYTGVKILSAEEKKVNLDDSRVITFLKKYLPISTQDQSGNFFIFEHGRWFATPLFLTLVFLEVSDILFAFDSVPAIFAVSREPFIVFTSNIFAVLGLRSMFFLLSDVMQKAKYIKYALAVILVFVGMKMTFLNELYGGKFPIRWSMLIIVSALMTAFIASWIQIRRESHQPRP